MRVLAQCDFKEEYYRKIEKALISHPPQQIIGLVFSKGIGNDEQWSWFEPMLIKYLPEKPVALHSEAPTVVFCDEFWAAYDYVAQFVEPWDVRQMGYIWDLAQDEERMMLAVPKSKPHLKYLWKIFTGMKVPKRVVLTAADVPEIINYGTKAH